MRNNSLRLQPVPTVSNISVSKGKPAASNLSTVLTLGDVAEDRFTVVGNEVQVAGKVPAVLHQYDRCPPVREVMHRRFS